MTPEEFRAARVQLGLTQAELARVLGYGKPIRVSEIERGIRNPSQSAVRLVQAYLAGYRPEDWG